MTDPSRERRVPGWVVLAALLVVVAALTALILISQLT